LKKDCFDLVGYPPRWQRKQVGRFTSGSSSAKRPSRDRRALSGKEQTAVIAQALEEFKSKLMASTAEGPADGHAEKGMDDCLTSWIIDSGATNHMTGSS
jgi:hypothetical protein